MRVTTANNYYSGEHYTAGGAAGEEPGRNAHQALA